MTRNQIAPGLFLTAIGGPYKKSRLSAAMIAPLRRETVTETALLPYLLERGTVRYPDVTALKRRLNLLYGTTIDTSYNSFGYARIIECVLQGVDGALVPDGSELTAERAGLLMDVLLRPALENGVFRADWMDIEREKLRDNINSIINDKAAYCFKLLTESFFKGDLRALPRDGFAEDLDAIDGVRLAEAYRETIANASAEILYVGPAPEEAQAKLLDFLGDQAWCERNIPQAPPVTKAEKVTELVTEMDVEQDKLSFAYATGKTLTRRQRQALRVGAALFGGTATSRLFQNVREKQSLCYSISASPSYEASGMYVECGIEGKNAARTAEAIASELAAFVKDGPTETELAQVKLLYRNMLGGLRDNAGSLAKYEFSSILRYGELTEPEDELAVLESISADEILEVMRALSLNCSSRLCGKAVAK